MQRGGLSRAGWPANKKQTVGFCDGGNEIFFVVGGQAQFIERNRLAGGENTHHHIFDPARGGNGRDAQFDIERPVFLELYFSVLRFALLGDIQIAHDLQARRQRIAIA